MRLIVDSNCLQSDELRSFLSLSRQNIAVLTDFAAMEAYSGDTLASIFKSMSVLMHFPKQVLVLKGSKQIAAQRGREAGLQRRLIASREDEFCKFISDLARAKEGDVRFQRSLLAHGKWASDHLAKMLKEADEMKVHIDFFAATFKKDERAIIRSGIVEDFTKPMVENALGTILEMCDYVYSDGHFARKMPFDELPNSFPFRIILCMYLLAIYRGSHSAAAHVRSDRIRNDMVDATFAAYGTYFDGLMTNDSVAELIYRQGRLLIKLIKQTR